MPKYRNNLPQLSGDLYLADAGIETDLIFNHGIEIREFAAHTLLPDSRGREALTNYFGGFLSLANKFDTGFVLDTQTWKAHVHWADDLGATEEELREANEESVRFIANLREAFSGNSKPIVLNAIIGPRGDAYSPQENWAIKEAQEYHAKQIGWLADTEVDMLTAMTFTQSEEAIGIIRAAEAAGLPAVISFTVETNGCLPTGQPLKEAVSMVDAATNSAAAYFMVNCAHPDHFFGVFDGGDWSDRIRGIRCNASRLSHDELDACEVLDDGDPAELAGQYKSLRNQMPWLNIFGGCCGSDLRHVTKIVEALSA